MILPMKFNSELFTKRLDFRTIFEVPLRQFVLWLGMVVLVSLAGYPGVVCVTPMAWLLALRVGVVCTARSRSGECGRRVLEADIAGGVLGFVYGLYFFVIVQFA